MARIEVYNWGKDVYSSPAAVVAPESLEELIAIMKDKEKYPAPVRAVGSNHSTTRCGVADGGTMVVMTRFDKILEVAESTVTA
jgi:FAD/FMN-containing dehydrogenase